MKNILRKIQGGSLIVAGILIWLPFDKMLMYGIVSGILGINAIVEILT